MLVPVQLNPPDGPISTMDDSLLEKREGFIDNEDEYTTWVEYWFNGVKVHRSVHVRVKKLPAMFGEAAKIGG